jgi:predicted nucleic acid-binding protein
LLFVDTSVWSFAFRRDHPPDDPRVTHLRHELETGGALTTTGIVLQELLQGIRGPKQRTLLLELFAPIALVDPERRDHVRAAEVRNACRRRGVQVGTIDALLVALCLRHELTLLTTDADFDHATTIVPLRIWSP